MNYLQVVQEIVRTPGGSNFSRRQHLGAKYGITTSDGRKVDDLIEEIAGACDTVIDEVRAEVPANFPTEVADPIFQGMRAVADKLRAE